jgi:HSP20 family protein
MVEKDVLEDEINEKKEKFEEKTEETIDEIDESINGTRDKIDEKINDKKEKFDEKKEKTSAKIDDAKEKFDEKKEKTSAKLDEKINEQKEKFDERKEKGKVYSEKVVTELNKTIDELKENLRNMQKYADDKINEYKNATISNLAVDLIECDNIYYLKVAVPGVSKEEVDIEASDNDIVITTTFKPFIEELEDIEDAKVIASELTVGKCSKTVRFENSIEVEEIKAKYADNGIIIITIPKVVIPKHKVTVE